MSTNAQRNIHSLAVAPNFTVQSLVQKPQFLGSALVLVHTLLQMLGLFLGHEQPPCLQMVPFMHLVWQLPQNWRSMRMLRHCRSRGWKFT